MSDLRDHLLAGDMSLRRLAHLQIESLPDDGTGRHIGIYAGHLLRAMDRAGVAELPDTFDELFNLCELSWLLPNEQALATLEEELAQARAMTETEATTAARRAYEHSMGYRKEALGKYQTALDRARILRKEVLDMSQPTELDGEAAVTVAGQLFRLRQHMLDNVELVIRQMESAIGAKPVELSGAAYRARLIADREKKIAAAAADNEDRMQSAEAAFWLLRALASSLL